MKFGHKREDGTFFQKDERDMARADFQMQLGQLAKIVAGLAREEKLSFSYEMRKKGNAKFALKDYAGATELYMQSLVGLDFGQDDTDRQQVEASIQVPVLTNLDKGTPDFSYLGRGLGGSAKD